MGQDRVREILVDEKVKIIEHLDDERSGCQCPWGRALGPASLCMQQRLVRGSTAEDDKALSGFLAPYFVVPTES